MRAPSTRRPRLPLSARAGLPLTALALLAAAPRAAAAADELECVPQIPTQIWSDSGSGGSHDVSIWRPASGLFLGDLAVGGYGHTGELCGFLDRAAEGGAPALAPARAFIWRYDDAKTGAHRNVSVWEPVCDPGFVAMGMVAAPSHLGHLKCPADQECAENGLRIAFDRFRCVRADLVSDLRGAPLTFVWNDRKTGGRHDVSFWSRPGAGAQAGLTNLAFFWAHRSHATPNPATPTTARHALRPGVVALPQPVEAVDDAHYYNIRLRGTNLYVAVEVAGVGEFYVLVDDAADPRAQFHLRKVGDRFQVVNRSGGGVMFAADRVGGQPIEDTAHVHRRALIPGLNTGARVDQWSVVPSGARTFKFVGTAAGAPVVWAAPPTKGARLSNLAQAAAPANQSLFELFPAGRVAAPAAPTGVFDPALGDDQALRLGFAVAAGLVSAATKGAGGGLINLVGVFALGNPTSEIAAALQRLYNQVQIDIGQEVAARALTESGNALLDATYRLTVDYSNTLRDNIGEPSRLISVQNSAKDAAQAFLAVRQRLTLERDGGGRIAAKPANAFLIDGGLPLFASAASLHAAALQEAAFIAAYDPVGSYEDELQTLDAEVRAWIREYRDMVDAQLTWRKDSVVVSTKTKAELSRRGFVRVPTGLTVTLSIADKPSLVSPQRVIGALQGFFDRVLKTNPPTSVENAIRARYRGELDFAYGLRYRPDALEADLLALRAVTAERCAKIRQPGSPERAAYLASAQAGRGVAPAAAAAKVGVKSAASKAQGGAPPPRSRLTMVKADGKITWVVEAAAP